MAGSSDIRAGKAFVEVYADKTKLARGLKSISGDFKAFGAGLSSLGTKFMALGTGIAAPLLAATKHFMAVGDQLDKMAARTGLSTNALSELGFAAEQGGSNIEEVEKSVRKMQKSIAGAAQGEKSYVDALLSIGLSYGTLKSLTPEQQFEAVARGINGITDPTLKAAAAMEIFGKSGMSLIPMLGDMEALRAEARRLGLSIGPEQAKAAADLADAWNRVKRSFGAVAIAIGSTLAPTITGLAEKIKVGIGSVRKWIVDHKTLIVMAFAVGAAAVAAGAGLFVLGKAITLAGVVIGSTLTIAKAASASFAFLQSAALLLANPFVLVGAAAVALGGYLLYASGAAGKAATWISSTFASLLAEVTSTFGVIADSMAAGDFVSAAKVGWALVKLEWTKGVAFVTGVWGGFKGFWDEACTGLAIGFVNAVASIQTAFAFVLGSMQNLWTRWEATLYSSPLYRKLTSKVAAAAYGVMGGDSAEFEKTMDDEMQKRAAAAQSQITANNAELDAVKAKIEADRQGRVGILGGDLANRSAGRDAAIAAAQGEVDAARAEWMAAKQQASAQASAGAGGNKFDFAKGLGPLDLEAAAGPKTSTRGTFSASAAAGLGVGGIQERIAKATEKTFQFVGQQTTVLKEIRDGLEAAP